MQVKGKKKLCVCDDYEKHFKSIQGRNGFTLFERYEELESIVNKHIDEKYRHFLAQPVVDGNDLHWFSLPYFEKPKRLSELEGAQRDDYQKVKDETLSHYRKVADELKNQNKSAEAEILESAIKFVNDAFVYCYDGKTVLGVWGMESRDEVRNPLGIVMKNAFEKLKKQPEVPEETEKPTPNKTSGETPDASDDIATTKDITTPPDPEPDPELKKTFKVRFSSGDHGTLHGQSEYDKYYEEKVVAGEIPDVIPEKKYRFIGWDRNPVNHIVTEDTEFIAQYEEVPVRRSWWAGLWGAGCLNWLLLLLLLALLGLLLWYLLGRTPFNFCGCDCTEPEYVVVDSPKVAPLPIDTIRDKDKLPEPTKNCGVHFSGWYLSDRNEYPWRDCSEIFQEEEFGEYVGQGYYPDNTKILPKSMDHSFDAVAVSSGTHLIMYEKPNFEGRIVLDVNGPMLIENVNSKGSYDKLMIYTFKEELQKLFPPERRQWSSENMHGWAKGSCKIICEQCNE